jgi:hypothetical protein
MDSFRAAIVLAVLAGMVGGCNGTDGTGDVTYNNDTANGATISDTNPDVPQSGPIASGQAYGCPMGSAHTVVIETVCGVANLFTDASYTCSQTKGSSTLLLIPANGKDSHNVFNVADCGTSQSDDVHAQTVRPTEAGLVLGKTYTATRDINGVAFSARWSYTRDPSVAAGKNMRPLSAAP